MVVCLCVFASLCVFCEYVCVCILHVCVFCMCVCFCKYLRVSFHKMLCVFIRDCICVFYECVCLCMYLCIIHNCIYVNKVTVYVRPDHLNRTRFPNCICFVVNSRFMKPLKGEDGKGGLWGKMLIYWYLLIILFKGMV